jgi:hypothetical protein
MTRQTPAPIARERASRRADAAHAEIHRARAATTHDKTRAPTDRGLRPRCPAWPHCGHAADRVGPQCEGPQWRVPLWMWAAAVGALWGLFLWAFIERLTQ